MQLKEFEIRWSDVDANRHLGNSAYINFMSHTRMNFLTQAGFGQHEMAKHNLGPIVLDEHIYYFKEAFPGKPIRVSLELKGMSEDGMFFQFHHNFYDHTGVNFARGTMMGAFINTVERKLCGLPSHLFEKMYKLDKATDFVPLTKSDTRKHGELPVDLSTLVDAR